MDLPSEGTRLSLAGYRGTVRFVGEVNNTPGIWLGIEWDDPHRGKHDGVKDGKQYFTCRVRNAGSFIRPSASTITYGTSFLEALISKYVENPYGSESQEKVLLGSSHGAIQVEAVRLDKIRGKLSDLQRLSEVSLDSENVAKCDPRGAIRNTCPNIRGLDLSTSLLPSWDVVALITSELPVLQRLALNRTRLEAPKNFATLATAFLCVTDLQLNGTMINWREMQDVTAFMPRLRLVEIGYNHLSRLSEPGSSLSNHSSIQTINLDSNECWDWDHICESIGPYTSLQRLILTSNRIETIPYPENLRLPLQGLKHLSLSFNRLKAWSDFDALSRWCPTLQTLTISGNPIVDDHELARYSRQFVISGIPSLVALDAVNISPKERSDCELFYLSYIVNHGPKSDDSRRREYPRWQALCEKHGTPEESPKGKAPSDRLSNRLIQLNVYRCFDPPRSDLDALEPFKTSKAATLRVLPTMSLRTLRLKLCKSLTIDSSKFTVTLWTKMDSAIAELGADSDARNLAWLGLEDGSDILFHVGDKK